MDRTRTALVIGATGGIGGELARTLQKRGWHVRALHRDPDRVRLADPSLDWLPGDAKDQQSVIRAAQGVSVIVHAASPPGYRNWQGLVLPMLDNTIAAAAQHRARVVLPGTIYNYGPDTPGLVDENTPQNPVSRKGKIRVAMERRLAEAADRGIASLVVRAGDFFGPRAVNSWLVQGMLPIPGPVKRVFNPAARGIGHAWAFLPDLAETMARLLERPDAPEGFERVHFDGHWVDDNRQFADAVRRAAGRPDAPIHPFPWPLVKPLGLFNETFRELGELRYLWRQPLRLDDGKLRRVLGDIPATPLDEALRRTLQGLGRLPASTGAA